MASLKHQQCERKRLFLTQESAEAGAKDLLLTRGDIVYPYRCCWCRGYHIGHYDKEKPPAKLGNVPKRIHKRSVVLYIQQQEIIRHNERVRRRNCFEIHLHIKQVEIPRWENEGGSYR